MKKKHFLFGALLLTVSAILAKVLGAIYRIPLTALLKTEGMGIYQLIFPIFALFLSVASSGIPIAISRMVGEEVALQRYENAKKIFRTSVWILALLGTIFSIILIGLSFFIAKAQGVEQAYICFIAIAPSLIFASILSAYKGYFQGLQKMSVSAFSNVIEQLFKLVFGLLFATYFMQYGTIYGVVGACLGISLSEFVAFLYALLYSIKFRNKKEREKQVYEIYSTKFCFKNIIKESLPITLCSLILPIVAVIDSFLIVNLIISSGFTDKIALTLYGISDGIIASLVSLPTVVTLSIATALIPHLGGLSSLKKKEEVESKSALAVKMVWLIALPCAAVMFLFSEEIVGFLYQTGFGNSGIGEIAIASNLLKISAISIIYISFIHIFTSILQALKKSYLPARNLLIASAVKIVLTFVLVSNPNFNIYGMVFADVVSYGLACIMDLNSIINNLNFNIKFSSFMFKPMLAVVLASSVAILFNNIMGSVLFGRIKTLLVLGVLGLTYLALLFILKTFEKDELPWKIFKKQKSTNK